MRYRLTRGLESYVARQADAVSAIAQPMLRDLRDRGLPPEKLFHVPNGVDANQFVPRECDRELARKLNPENDVVFGFFGSLYRYEGIAWLVGAVSQLRARQQRVKLLVVGAGEEEAVIRAAICRHDASGYVSVLPRVSHSEIMKYYSIVDVMVFPRLRVRLTELVTPLKPLEAMSMAKPVLASDVGGHRELVQDEVAGLLFQSENIVDFCDRATRLVASPELRRQLGERGRDIVLRESDWKMIAERYQRVYEFALRRQQRRPSAFRTVGWALSAGRRKDP
ncbi:MAG: glycosyltransferase family 4 protein [Candidatus Korobacteraceae bacterium]